ncbi:carboxymethylenebutenolidase homolog [Saccoglossus kowalevskii]|uniref:Carboxymethylenebutenolidase homolog n=1 Tax=Saccoglossus kowalevskii TaxID=10224 RepID=A0A1L7H7F0_SACKO|nr:PREDICTED: carboxymethylenebutenolidase homolog [Saccoglossus kowalevskii]APU50771.1 dienelactone hydrolase-like protein 154 [Saccoglossus kowalevskii]
MAPATKKVDKNMNHSKRKQTNQKRKRRHGRSKRIVMGHSSNHITRKIAIMLVLGILLLLGFTAAVLTFTLYRPLWSDGRDYTSGSSDEHLNEEQCELRDLGGTDPINSTVLYITDDVMAYVVRPIGCSIKSAIVILHDEKGFESEASRQLANDLGMRGYVAVVPNMFTDSSMANKSTLHDWFQSLKDPCIEVCVEVTISYLREELGALNIGMVGFSWGGQKVAASAAIIGNIQATVIFYGLEISPEMALSMRAPTLLIYAQNDTMIHISDIYANEELLRAANRLLPRIDADDNGLNGSPVYIEVVENMGHGFLNQNDISSSESGSKAVNDMYWWLNKYLSKPSMEP